MTDISCRRMRREKLGSLYNISSIRRVTHTHTHTQPNTGKNCVDSNLRKKMEASERGWDGKYKDIFIRNAGDQKGGK